MRTGLPQIVRYVTQTPWAVRLETLHLIRQIVALRASGVKLEAEEIEQRIGARKPQLEQPPQASAVGVLPLWGVLVPHTVENVSGGGTTALDSWLEELRAMVADPKIGTILLDVDSPGGSVELVPEVAAEIRAARSRKQIVAVANTDAGSGGFWLATQASEFYVSPSGKVGSVGVYAAHEDISAQLEAEGIKVTLVSAGEHKLDNNPFEPLSPEAEAEMQHKVDAYYEMFVADVAKGRGVEPSTVEANYGQGKMFVAADALKAGMVDGIASRDEVLNRLLKPQAASRGSRALTEAASGPAALPGAMHAGGVVIHAPQLRLQPREAVLAQDDFNRSAASSAKANSERKERTMEHAPTLEELAARKDEILARMTELDSGAAGRALNEEEQAEFDVLDAEHQQIEQIETNMNDRRSRVESKAREEKNVVAGVSVGVKDKNIHTNGRRQIPDNPFDLAAYRGFAKDVDDLAERHKEGARTVSEQLRYESGSRDEVREHVEKLLAKDKGGTFALRLLSTADSAYERAFGKLLMGKPLSTQEDGAIKAAISNTGLGSELPVPVTIDPTVILTSDGATNPLRAISRVETITGPKWQGISSDGVDVAYQAELTEVADQTPDFDAPEVEPVKAQGYVEFSIEVDQDWGSLRAELARMFQDAKDVKEAEKFQLGTGVNEPHGIVHALRGTASEVQTASINTLALDDLDTLIGDLPPRFDSGAQLVGNRGVYSALRRLADDLTNFWLPQSQGLRSGPEGTSGYTLDGYPVNYASEMSKAVTTGGEDVLIVGDFKRGFIIVDRVGLNVELIPHVLGANRRPKGARALYTYWRNSSEVLAINAFRMLRIKVT